MTRLSFMTHALAHAIPRYSIDGGAVIEIDGGCAMVSRLVGA